MGWKEVFKFHACKICQYRTKSLRNMQNHANLHETRSKSDVFSCVFSTPEMLQCDLCDFGTSLAITLDCHKISTHNGFEVRTDSDLEFIVKPFYSKNFDFETFSRLVLLNHCSQRCDREQISRGDVVLQCPDSTTSCTQQHSESRNLHCDHQFKTEVESCQTRFIKQPTITKHVRDKTSWFACQKCPHHRYKRHANLREHNLRVHTDNILKCLRCKFITFDREKFERHLSEYHVPHQINSPKWEKCNFCSCRVKKQCIERHYLVNHVDHDKLKPLLCENFQNQVLIKKCIAIDHSYQKSDVEKNSGKDLWVQCDQCSWITKNKHMNRHMLQNHTRLK